MSLIPIVVGMQEHGFPVDRTKLEQMQADALAAARQLTTTLREKFSSPQLNPDSPDQIKEAFIAAGLDLENTDETTLSASSDERSRLVLDYRVQDASHRPGRTCRISPVDPCVPVLFRVPQTTSSSSRIIRKSSSVSVHISLKTR